VKKILALFFTLIISVLITYIFLPKFLLIDKILLKNKVFILPQKVNEGMFNINLKKADIYYENKPVIKNSDINLYVYPLSQGLILICENKKSEIIHKTLGGYIFDFNNFKCLNDFSLINGKLEIKGGIKGKIRIEGFKVQGKNVEFLEFLFKGKIFDFKGNVQGINIAGSGIISFNEKNPLNSKINATTSAVGFNFIISGNLTNLQFKIQ
jgi:hypothetical protein